MKQLSKIAIAATMLAFASLASADLNRAGPANVPSPPGHGFPFWYQDLNGTVLDICIPTATATQDPDGLQETACLLAAPPALPYTFPTSFPDEVFYHRVVSDPLTTSTSGKRAILVLALEAAFATGAPAAGQQVVFTRIRVTAGVPFDGDYVVTHPYGTETFPNVTSGVGNRDIVFSEDIGIAPGVFTDALSSRVGPFLQHSDAGPGGAPAAPLVLPFGPNGAVAGSRLFLGDGVTGRFITGSPFATNYFELCGPLPAPTLDLAGIPVPNTGNPNYGCYRQDLFTVTGMLRDLQANPIGSPLSIQRATYNRDDTATRVDVMARASRSPGQGTPKLTAGGENVPPVLMDGPTALGDWYAQGIPFPPGVVPSNLAVTNSGDVPPTTVTSHVTDEVTIKSATHDSASSTITVVATSSDKGAASLGIGPSVLALAGFPGATREPGPNAATDPAEVKFTATGVSVPPAFVRVASDAGGQGVADLGMGLSTRTFPAGVPFAGDDSWEAVQNGPTVIIRVLDNDVPPAGETLNGASLAVLAPNANIGRADPTIAPNQGFIAYTPPSTTGIATFRYTITGAAGTSNVATVTVNVLPDPNGPVPTAVNDPSGAGAINATVGQTVTINVLANDNGNGGTLNPASVVVSQVPAAGTAVANANGTIAYTAAAAGTYTFQYTVSNLASPNGTVQVSNPATVTVTVAAVENLTFQAPAKCDSRASKWQLRGTSNISVGNSVSVLNDVVGSPARGTVIGSAPVVNGAWQFQGTATCVGAIKLRSTVGTTIGPFTVQVK
ncbi:MAG: Ig-like domain-containing protein [Anaeromyxobacteraceae bacterium]